MRLTLSGLDGTSTLGFLAALGVLTTATSHWCGARWRLSWDPDEWQAVLEVDREMSQDDLVRGLWNSLHRERPRGAAGVAEARRAYEDARRRLKQANQDLKVRRLPRTERAVALAVEIAPLKEHQDSCRRAWRSALVGGAPDPVVSLGSDLTVSSSEFHEFCLDAQAASNPNDRRLADYAAAYGVASFNPDERIRATPLALLNGSGHQHFLGSAAELMVMCRPEHIAEAVFGPWHYRDERFSLRLDPIEDRRYALMAVDPTASGNKPQTVWGANRLAFESLPLFPVVGTGRNARVVCMAGSGQDVRFCWPLWEDPLSLNAVRTLLASGVPEGPGPQEAQAWRARGVAGVWAARRIAVGSGANAKYNLTPSVACWR